MSDPIYAVYHKPTKRFLKRCMKCYPDANEELSDSNPPRLFKQKTFARLVKKHWIDKGGTLKLSIVEVEVKVKKKKKGKKKNV